MAKKTLTQQNDELKAENARLRAKMAAFGAKFECTVRDLIAVSNANDEGSNQYYALVHRYNELTVIANENAMAAAGHVARADAFEQIIHQMMERDK